MNKLEKWLFRHLCGKIDRVLIGKTTDTKEPVITFLDERDHFASLWLSQSKDDDSAKIRTVTPY